MEGLAIIFLIAFVSATILKVGMYCWGELGGIILAIIIIVLMLAAKGYPEVEVVITGESPKYEYSEEMVCEPETVKVFVPETTCFVNYNMYGYPSGHICFPGNSEGIITRPTCTRTARQKTRTGIDTFRNQIPKITIGE